MYYNILQNVLQDKGYYGWLFQLDIGLDQGKPVRPIILNMVFDAVVWDTLLDICGPQEAQHSMGWATGEHYIVVYSDDGLIMCRNPIWFQGMLTTPIRMFNCLRLYTNLGKTKSITCTPVFVWGYMGQDEYKRR